MTTVAQLAAAPHAEFAYLLVLQGVPFMFTDRSEIAGSGPGSWIGTGYGPRRVRQGLEVPRTITFATQREDGRPECSDGATFKILDIDRELVAFFRTQYDAPTVGGRLSPKADPAPATLIGPGGNDVPVWGKWLNGEAIGPAGERNYFSMYPEGDAAGEDHAAILGSTSSLAPSTVYPTPTMLEGRRCALYRIFQDRATGVWPLWQDQRDSGESLIWVGTVTQEGCAVATLWTLKCDGPSSHLRKQLGANRPDRWAKASGGPTVLVTTPGEREDLFALQFWYQQVLQPEPELGSSSLFDEVLDVLPGTGNASAMRAAINARIAVVAAAAGPDITWTTERNAQALLEQGWAQTRIDKNADAAYFCRAAVWRLTLHEKVWRMMGYDPILQNATDFSDAGQIRFFAGNTPGVETPGPLYYTAEFSTVPVTFASVDAAKGLADNKGAPRYHYALSPQNPAMLPAKGRFTLSWGYGTGPYMEGQTNRPPALFTLPGGPCDTTGYFAFRGSFKASATAEVTTMVQVAKCSWINDTSLGGDTIALEPGTSLAKVYVERWIDPRWYGCDNEPLKNIVWTSSDLEVAAVNVLGHDLSHGDLAHRVLLNLMLSTGTASWEGVEGEGTLTNGANAHPDIVGKAAGAYNDTEIADLGLGIPWRLIDAKSFAAAAQQLPGGGMASGLNRCRYAWIGSQDSQDLVAAILAPRAWGMGFCRGRWRLFSMPELLIPEKVEVALGPEDFVGDDRTFVENVLLRPAMPREVFSVTYGKPLVSEAASDLTLKTTVRARDAGARCRRDNGVAEVEGWGLVPTALWRGENPPPDWATAWSGLFGEQMARFYNSPYVMAEGVPVLPSKARQLGPGSVVRFTSLFAPSREGEYGMSNKLGRVYKVVHDLGSRVARVDILLQPGGLWHHRRFAPIASLLDMIDFVEGRHDAASRTVFCYRDKLRHGGDVHDVTYFAEPAGYGVGGDALVHGWQHDGRRWSRTFSFVVESVSVENDSITYKPGSLSGKIWEARYTYLVLAPWDLQAPGSWVRSLFVVICKPDGTFGVANTPGFKLSK